MILGTFAETGSISLSDFTSEMAPSRVALWTFLIRTTSTVMVPAFWSFLSWALSRLSAMSIVSSGFPH